MKASITDFDLLKSHQFCDNPDCPFYQQTEAGNIKIHCRQKGQVYCNCCKSRPFVVTKGTIFYWTKTPLEKVVSVLSLAARGMGVNNICAQEGVTADSINAWIIKAADHVEEFTTFMQQDMNLDQVQIDEFWSFIQKKKENLTLEEQKLQEAGGQLADNQADRWTFAAILPRSGFINAVHSSKRNSEEAAIFLEKIKDRSNGMAPLFLSDAWFYKKPLFDTYSHYVTPVYSGRGRPRNPIRVVDESLQYAQVYKKRDDKGRLESVETRIIKGDKQEILDIIAATSRGATKINTSFIEGKNGTYRKDNARLARKSACHSKKALYHDKHIYFLTGVFNYCRANIGLREEINPHAERFKQKYRHVSPAMKEGFTDKILTIKELLVRRPKKVAA